MREATRYGLSVLSFLMNRFIVACAHNAAVQVVSRECATVYASTPGGSATGTQAGGPGCSSRTFGAILGRFPGCLAV